MHSNVASLRNTSRWWTQNPKSHSTLNPCHIVLFDFNTVIKDDWADTNHKVYTLWKYYLLEGILIGLGGYQEIPDLIIFKTPISPWSISISFISPSFGENSTRTVQPSWYLAKKPLSSVKPVRCRLSYFRVISESGMNRRRRSGSTSWHGDLAPIWSLDCQLLQRWHATILLSQFRYPIRTFKYLESWNPLIL